jgi:hypothetical protein
MRLCSSRILVYPQAPWLKVQKFTTTSIIGLVFALMLLTAQTAGAQQNYTYRMGNARVQCGSGLASPSATYISRGTLSPSAQVPVLGSPPAQTYYQQYQPQSSGLPGLPSARMGSTVGMPGDYMRSDINPNVTFQRQQQASQPRQGNGYIIMQAPRRANNVYGGGSNRPATYGSAGSPGYSAPAASAAPAAASTSSSTYSSNGGTSFKGY